MKKIILGLIATIGLSGLSFGQAVLEHTYESRFNFEETNAFLTEDGLHFFTYHDNSNVVQVYNSSHTLVKTINIPYLGGSSNITLISLMSDKLFNNDNLLEFLVNSGNNLFLVNENGIILQNFGDVGYDFDIVHLIKVENDYKLIICHYQNYTVYSLPGTYLEIEGLSVSSKLFGYPNPTANKIMITNPLENGENALLEVFDMTGKRVIHQNISGNETLINLDVSNLNNGTYIYKINGQTSKFIKK